MSPLAPNVTLRPPVAGEAPLLAALGERAFVAKFGALYQPDDLAAFLAETHAVAKVEAEIADPTMRIRVAEAGGGLVGFCKLVMTCQWPEHARGCRAIELKQIYTDPDRVGGGIGAALTAWALAEAEAFGADEVQLSVFSGNADAQRFYARHGFTKVADIAFWVGRQRDHEFLMAMRLPAA